jgi:hypothetical protein
LDTNNKQQPSSSTTFTQEQQAAASPQAPFLGMLVDRTSFDATGDYGVIRQHLETSFDTQKLTSIYDTQRWESVAANAMAAQRFESHLHAFICLDTNHEKWQYQSKQ